MTHYRSPIDFTEEKLEQSRASWERIRLAVQNADRILGGAPCDEPRAAGHPLLQAAEDSVVRFHGAMNDDFGTPDALAVVFDLVTEMNRAGAEVSRRRDPAAVAAVCTARRTIGELLSILGYADPASGEGGSSELTGQLMELLIELRQRARSEKRFADADMIRDRLTQWGIVLEDHKDGTTWRKKE